MSLSMHFFRIPNEIFESRGFTSPRPDDARFLECIISQEEVGHLQNAWGIHIWMLHDREHMPRRGDPFRLTDKDLERLKAKLESAARDARLVKVPGVQEINQVRRYKMSWQAQEPGQLKAHFPYKFDNISAGDVGQGLKIVNHILDSTDFENAQVWYYPLY